MQIAEQPAIGVNPDGVCFVIAAAPFIGYPIVESIVQPMINLHDIAKAGKADPPFVRWQRTFSVGPRRPRPGELGLRPVAVRGRPRPAVHPAARRVPVRRRALRLHDADGLLGVRPAADWVPTLGDACRAADRQLVPCPAQRPDTARRHRPRPTDRRDHLRADADSAGIAASPGRRRLGPPSSPSTTRSRPTCRRCSAKIRSSCRTRASRHPPGSCATRSGRGQPRRCRPAFRRASGSARSLPPPPFSNASESTMVRSVGERHFWTSQLAMPRTGSGGRTSPRWASRSESTTASSTRCATASTASTPQDDDPLMHEYIVADVPMDVTEAPPAEAGATDMSVTPGTIVEGRRPRSPSTRSCCSSTS